MIFYRESELPPGVYSMETVVHDAPSRQVQRALRDRRSAATDEDTLRMSSLVLVKRGEKVPEKDRRADNPLLVNGVVLSPESRRSGQQGGEGSRPSISPSYPAHGRQRRRTSIDRAAAERQAGRRSCRCRCRPPTPTGRIQQLGRLPLDQLAPGTYELRAVVKQGDQQVVPFDDVANRGVSLGT